MPQPIKHVAPGVLHWTSVHPSHGLEVSSYLLTEHGVLFDPIAPPEGVDWFGDNDIQPREILLSCRLHRRDSRQFVDRYGCGVRASRAGMHQFEADDRVTPFDFGDTLAGGVQARMINTISPDETAFVAEDLRLVVIADGIVDFGQGLQFVPDHLLGDDPAAIKQGLVNAFARLIEEVDFDHLLLAHGDPRVGSGRNDLRQFLAGMA